MLSLADIHRMNRPIAFLVLFLILPAAAQGQPDASDLTPFGEDNLSHIRGVTVIVTHRTSNRAVDAGSQIEADVEKAIRRSGLKLYSSPDSDPSRSEATLSVRVETNLQRNESVGFYIGSADIELDLSQKATLYGGQEIVADTYEIAPTVRQVLSGKGRALDHARRLAGSYATVRPGGPQETLEVAREYVRAATQRFIRDWERVSR